MSHLTHIASTLFVAIVASACTQAPADTFGASDVAAERVEPTGSFDILASPLDAASGAELVVSGIWIEDSPTTFAVDVMGGVADIEREGDTLVLTAFSVELDRLDHELPGGSELSDMALVLEQPIELETRWSDGSVRGRAALALRLDWSISTTTSRTPLASQDVEALPIEVVIEDVGGELRLEARLQGDSTVFELPDLFSVEEIDVAMAATAAP